MNKQKIDIINNRSIQSQVNLILKSLQKMKVVILAGGKGSRISFYTQKIPKPMIKFNGNASATKIIFCKINILEYFLNCFSPKK